MKVYIAKDFDGGVWAYAEKPWMEDGRWYGGVIADVPFDALTPDEYQLLEYGKVITANAVLAVTKIYGKHIED